MERFMVALFVTLSLLLGCAFNALSATLSWNPNTEADLAGYNAYRASGTCTNPANFVKVNPALLPKSVTPSWVDTPTQDGDYCWVVTAVDTGNLESVFSNKAGMTVNVNPPGGPTGLVVK